VLVHHFPQRHAELDSASAKPKATPRHAELDSASPVMKTSLSHKEYIFRKKLKIPPLGLGDFPPYQKTLNQVQGDG